MLLSRLLQLKIKTFGLLSLNEILHLQISIAAAQVMIFYWVVSVLIVIELVASVSIHLTKELEKVILFSFLVAIMPVCYLCLLTAIGTGFIDREAVSHVLGAVLSRSSFIEALAVIHNFTFIDTTVVALNSIT